MNKEGTREDNQSHRHSSSDALTIRGRSSSWKNDGRENLVKVEGKIHKLKKGWQILMCLLPTEGTLVEGLPKQEEKQVQSKLDPC